MIGRTIALLIASALTWFVLVQVPYLAYRIHRSSTAIQLLRLSIKALLCYKGWMYESPGKPISTPTKLWLVRAAQGYGRDRRGTQKLLTVCNRRLCRACYA